MDQGERLERREQAVEMRLTSPRDIEDWMALVSRVKDDFPGLESAEGLREHREATLRFMQNGSALCADPPFFVSGTPCAPGTLPLVG